MMPTVAMTCILRSATRGFASARPLADNPPVKSPAGATASATPTEWQSNPVAWGLGALLVAAAALVVTSRISFSAFYISGAAVVLVLAVLAYLRPREALIAVVFAPIVDRYLASLLIPESLHGTTNFLSESLLVLVGFSVLVRGIRDRTLVAALRHPVVYVLAAFAVVCGISAIVNGVPPLVAAGGVAFTIEAATLFVLPRVLRFSTREGLIAAVGLTALATVAALLALGQVLLDPAFLGLESISGRFAEGNRIAAFLVNPNMLGVVLAIGTPFPLIASVRADDPRVRWAARISTFLIVLALFYTFSRGAWLGLAVTMLGVGLILDRRALLSLIAMAALAYGAALVLPRHVLSAEPEPEFDVGRAIGGRFDSFGAGNDLRLLFIQNALPIIADHPVVGAGPGRYGGSVAARLGSPLYERYTAGRVPVDRTVDNFWLHLLVESGVVGVTIFGSALLLALREMLVTGRRLVGWDRALLASACVIAVVVAIDSLVEMLLEGNTTSFAMYFFLGVGSAIAARPAVSVHEAAPLAAARA
jgi:O-antigen ligase